MRTGWGRVPSARRRVILTAMLLDELPRAANFERLVLRQFAQFRPQVLHPVWVIIEHLLLIQVARAAFKPVLPGRKPRISKACRSEVIRTCSVFGGGVCPRRKAAFPARTWRLLYWWWRRPIIKPRRVSFTTP